MPRRRACSLGEISMGLGVNQQNQDTVFSTPQLRSERRRTRRARVGVYARVRRYNSNDNTEEVRPAVNVSRDGVYFIANRLEYKEHMHLYVVCPDSESRGDLEKEIGRVVRVDSLANGMCGVAVSFLRSPTFHSRSGLSTRGRER